MDKSNTHKFDKVIKEVEEITGLTKLGDAVYRKSSQAVKCALGICFYKLQLDSVTVREMELKWNISPNTVKKERDKIDALGVCKNDLIVKHAVLRNHGLFNLKKSQFASYYEDIKGGLDKKVHGKAYEAYQYAKGDVKINYLVHPHRVEGQLSKSKDRWMNFGVVPFLGSNTSVF